MEDKELQCAETNCGPFIWTKGEQEFYEQKGMESSEGKPWTPPKRCPKHRAAAKARRESNNTPRVGDSALRL